MVQVSSEFDEKPSQRKLRDINNNGGCCDARLLTDSSHETVEGAGEIAQEKTLSQESVLVSSQNVLDEAQQDPLKINDNGDCSDSKTELATSTEDLRGKHIPEKYRQGVLDIEEWLSDTVTDTPETFQGMLNVAFQYLRLVPEAKKCLWEQLKGDVKTLMWQLFPDYYQVLSRG